MDGLISCPECQTAFNAKPRQAFCSERCRRLREKRRAGDRRRAREKAVRPVRICSACGGEVTIRRGPTMGICRVCYSAGRPWTGIQRARARGVAWEKFWPAEILQRDNWTCQLCGDPTPRELRGTTDPKAPEVDHIIPLGPGPHSRVNSQCLCRDCNRKKGRQ